MVITLTYAARNTELLNANSGAITVVFSGLVAISTVAYAILTWRLVSETKRMREVQTEPNISISIQQAGRWGNELEMIIQNIGSGEAFDVTFEVETDLTIMTPVGSHKKRFVDLNIIKNGLRSVAPHQSYVFQFQPIPIGEEPEP
ncbi:MAG: hypothetical protein ACXVIB_05720, partial [Halobacteriota archaeon]